MNENTVRLFNIHFFINKKFFVKDRVSAFIAFRTVYILLTKNGRTKT